jgi:hypothetical protein
MIQRHELEKVILKKNSVLITAVLDRLRGSITRMSLDELSSLTKPYTPLEDASGGFTIPIHSGNETMPFLWRREASERV